MTDPNQLSVGHIGAASPPAPVVRWRMSKKTRALCASALWLSLTGCDTGTEKPAAAPAAAALSSTAPALDQTSICEVDSYTRATSCAPGQKIVFLPKSFGNEQLPVLFAAINCDMRYSIALTKGAVACVFLPLQPIASATP